MIDPFLCRLCGNPTHRFLSLGACPSPNRLLTLGEIGQPEPAYPMDLTFCENCWVVQSEATIPPEDIFTVYPYSSSTAATTRAHFEGLADTLVRDHGLGPGSVVVEIASNDGVLQRPLRDRGVRAIGVEPARNICELAWRDGLETLNEFFTEATVEKIGEGAADAIIACNVYTHLPALHTFTENVRRLLKPTGIFVIEIEYLLDMIQQAAYGNVYQDHVSYFTLGSLANFLEAQGLFVFHAERISPQGGSLRVFASPNPRPSNLPLLETEKELGLYSLSTYEEFAKKVEDSKRSLVTLLRELKGAGKTIAGYGAAAKGLSLLNYCHIGAETLSYIVDDSILKQGRLTPMNHLPIVGPGRLIEDPVDYLLVLAWNMTDEIKTKTRGLRVKYIVPSPAALKE